MRTYFVLIAFLLGAIVLSYGATIWFDIQVVALFTALFVAVQKIKFLALIEWLFKISVLKFPQRTLTSLFLRILGIPILINWVKVQLPGLRAWWRDSRLRPLLEQVPEHWRTHPSMRLITKALFVLVIVIGTTFFGVVVVLFFGFGEIRELFLRFIWPSLSETAWVQALTRAWKRFEVSRFGRFIAPIKAWQEKYVHEPLDRLRDQLAREALKLVEETLTYQLQSHPHQPPQKPTRQHEHLVDDRVTRFIPEPKKKRLAQKNPRPRPRR